MDKFIKVAKRWYEKAIDCDDSFDQFISIWISFNAIYGRRGGKEFQKIQSIISEFDDNVVTHILSYEEVRFFCNIDPSIKYLNLQLEINDTSYEQGKLKRYINRNPRVALESLMSILNKVRNNLFHGDKRIENIRDVDIVRNAYPIIREIVKNYLGLDVYSEVDSRNTATIRYSLEEKLNEKIVNLQREMDDIVNNYDVIPKYNNHPISILLDRINMQANAFEFDSMHPQQMAEIRSRLLKLYEERKPRVLRDIEEVHNFVYKRMADVIEEGCSVSEVKKFYEDYIELQDKYLSKGYRMNK